MIMPSTSGVVEQRCTLPELLPMSGVRRPSTCGCVEQWKTIKYTKKKNEYKY